MTVRARAPLRLGLAGGGTDVSPYCDRFGGLVLNATIDLYAYATLTLLHEPRLRFVAADQGKGIDYALQASVPIDGPLPLHQGVYNRIVRDFRDGEPLPIILSTYSDAPAGSGLGASSTLVVAMVTAFVELLELPLGKYDIARLAYEIERVDLGLAGGRQDHFAATFGGVNFMEFHAGERVVVNPLQVEPWILCELEATTILFYTGVSRESARIIAEQQRRMTCGDADAVGALHQLKDEAEAMKECLLRGDFARLAQSMQKGWAAKQLTAPSISNDNVQRAIDAAKAAGAYAGKISGAGGGGFLMLLADPQCRADVCHALRALGEGEIHNCHFTGHRAQAWRID
jgi:D-glycero-alpha-D-manno-heptose-7-phosphate kinase